MKHILLTLMVFGSFEAFAKENVFICDYSNSSGPNIVEFTLIINTKLKYLRFGDAKYDEDFKITDLYIKASRKNDLDFDDQSISFNNITGEVARRTNTLSWFYKCQQTSKLVEL